MTLIQTKVFPEGAILVSDIMLTRDQPSSNKNSMWLIAEGKIQEANYSSVGHMQKTVLFNRRCLFQWAGQMIVARSIFNFLKPRLRLTFEEIEKQLHIEFNSTELDAVAFSLVRIRSGRIELFGHHGEHIKQGENLKWLAGSGAFIADPRNHPAEKTFSEGTFGEAVIDDETSDLLLRLYHGEAGAYTYDPFRAGGWYEVITVRDQLFFRVPYAVCFYDLAQMEKTGSYDPTLAIFSRYMNDRLLIHRVWGNKSSCIINVVKSFKDRFDGEVTEPNRYFLGGLHNWEFILQITLRSGDQQVVSRIVQDPASVDDVEIHNLHNPEFLSSSETKQFLQEQLQRPLATDDDP